MTTSEILEHRIAAQLLEASGGIVPSVHLVVGSGLQTVGEHWDHVGTVAFRNLEGFGSPTVAGHAGEFQLVRVGSVPLLVQRGRFHRYEGCSVDSVALPILVGRRLGARRLVLTNAAGSLMPAWPVPALMAISDHLDLQGGRGALRPASHGVTHADVYDRELTARLMDTALTLGVRLESGVYAGVLGPQYETKSEVRMLQAFGAHVVGMSTVLEARTARTLGMRVVGLSVITNRAAGLQSGPLSHQEVLAAGHEVVADLDRLLSGFLSLTRLRGGG